MTTTDTKPNNPLAAILGNVLKPKTAVNIKPESPDIIINIAGIPAKLLFPLLKDLFAKLEAEQ